ncbi:oligosaccharide flippase family protein [Desulfobacterota bacterium M19]
MGKTAAGSGKKIISHGKIYLTGTILQRSVSFIMLPIYTRCLTPSDYGTIELLSMTLDFVGIILGLRIGEAIFRYYADYKNKTDKNEVISTALWLVAILNVAGFLFIAAGAKPISTMVFGNTEQIRNLLLFALTMLMQGFIGIPMTYIRARQRPWLFVVFSTIKLTLQLGLNILFVVYLRLHVEGVIYSAIISALLMGCMLGFYTLKECGIRFSRQKARRLISFSLPMMATGIIAFYITFGDRYFLRFYSGGLNEVGVYSLGYKFGFMLMFLIVMPFASIWDSEKYNIAQKKTAKEEFQKIFIIYSTVVILACICISLYVKNLLHIMSAPSFWGAAQIVPVILGAYLANAFSQFVNLGILLRHKTIEITYGTIIAAGVISLGYFLLIPRYGAMGAAWATLLAFASRTLWVYWRAKKLYDMGLCWKSAGLLIGLWLIVYICSMYGPANFAASLLLNSSLLIVVALTLLYLPILPDWLRRDTRRILRNPRSAVMKVIGKN